MTLITLTCVPLVATQGGQVAIIANRSSFQQVFTGLSAYRDSIFLGLSEHDVWEVDAQTYELKYTYNRLPYFYGYIESISADDKSVIALGGNNVYLWRREFAAPTTILPANCFVTTVLLNDSIIVSGCEYNWINIWNRTTLSIVKRFQTRPGAGSGTARSIMIINRYLAVGDDLGLQLFDINSTSNTPVKSFFTTGHLNRLAADEDFLYGQTDSQTLYKWSLSFSNILTWTPAWTKTVNTNVDVSGLAAHKGFFFIADQGSPSVISQYDRDGNFVRITGQHDQSIHSIRVHSGKLISTGYDGCVKAFTIPEFNMISTSRAINRASSRSQTITRTRTSSVDGVNAENPNSDEQASASAMPTNTITMFVAVTGFILIVPPIAFMAYLHANKRLPWESSKRNSRPHPVKRARS